LIREKKREGKRVIAIFKEKNKQEMRLGILAQKLHCVTASRSRRVAGLHKGYCIHPAASVGCQGMQMNLALQPRPKKFRTLMGDASGGR